METKHTPGPWHATKHVNLPWEVCTSMIRVAEHVLVVQMNGAADGPEQEANARLIAAAPELLEICQEISDDSRCDLVNSERRMRLYAAIAKATGG